MKSTHVVSQVGVGSLNTGELEMGLGRGRKVTQDRPAEVAWNGWVYLTDAGVERYATPLERMDLQRLSGSLEVQALTWKTLHDLLADVLNPTAAIVVGLPVEVMANESLAQRTRDDLRAWLEGEHTFSVNGQELTVTVPRVTVMAQPAGAFCTWGLDDLGRWRRTPVEQRATVAIADIGFNTLDVFTLAAGQIQARFTGGDSLGMRRAAELLSQAVQRDHGCTLSLHQADTLLREARPELYLAGQMVDLSRLAIQARATNAAQIVSFLEAKWDNGRQFGQVLFTGGGAEALRDELLRHYPHGVILENPVMANALGLARAGWRSLSKIAPYVIGLDPGFGGFKGVRLGESGADSAAVTQES